MGKLKIEISGPGAEVAENELYEVLRAEFGVDGRRVSLNASDHEPGQKIDPNTLAIVAIVVAIPGAIDTMLNLAKRVELTQKVKQLVAWGRRHNAPGVKIVLVSPKGRSLDLESADPGDVVEAFTEAHDDDTAARKP